MNSIPSPSSPYDRPHGDNRPSFSSSEEADSLPPFQDEDQGEVRGAPSPGGDALMLLPEVESSGRAAGSQRPFQRRRRSRACDACRARKTKCTTPMEGSCSACTAASLVCKFSDRGDDRRRAGPTRKVRALEAQLQELSQKLVEAESVNNALRQMRIGALSSPASTTPRDQGRPSPLLSEEGSSPRFYGSSSSFAGSAPGSARRLPGEVGWWGPDRRLSDANVSTIETSPSSSTGLNVQWRMSNMDGHSQVNPSFISSYSEYLRNLGFAPGNVGNDHPSLASAPDPSPRVPLVTDYPSMSEGNPMPVDLRIYLPPKDVADKVMETFRSVVYLYMPMLHWPTLMHTYKRAYEQPMWEHDVEVVRSVFCPLQMLMAVGSQMIDSRELDIPAGGGMGVGQERVGWKFFHTARKYCDLNNSAYSKDTVLYFYLMGLYLDNASLPSPCWMINGATARVCQDIGLDKNLPRYTHNDFEMQIRCRLFWAAYISDRKSSLKKGRVMVLRDSDIEIGLPQILPDEKNRTQEDLGPNHVEGGQSHAYPGRPDPEETTKYTLENSFRVFRAQIRISRLCERIGGISMRENGGPGDVAALQELDEELKRAWEEFPKHYTDLESIHILDPAALRPLLFLLYCRLLLYRYFTSPDQPDGPLNPNFRTFCLGQSIQAAKITAHLLFRASKKPVFDSCYGLRTDELVHIQTFRAAIILLLGFYSNENEEGLMKVSEQEVDVCRRALEAVAHYHFGGKKLLHLFEGFAKVFNYPSHTSETPQLQMNFPVKEEHVLGHSNAGPLHVQQNDYDPRGHPWATVYNTQDPSQGAGGPAQAVEYSYVPIMQWDPNHHVPAPSTPHSTQSLDYSQPMLASPIDLGDHGHGAQTMNYGGRRSSIDWGNLQQALHLDSELEAYISGPPAVWP